MIQKSIWSISGEKGVLKETKCQVIIGLKSSESEFNEFEQRLKSAKK